MSYCSEHGIQYSSFRCPRCEADDRAARLEDALLDHAQGTQRHAERLEQTLQEQQAAAREAAARYSNPGDFVCPHCRFRTLLVGASICVMCRGVIDAAYWKRVGQQQAEERRVANERAQLAQKKAAEAAREEQAQLLATEKVTSRIEMFQGCTAIIVFLLVSALVCFDIMR